MMQLNSEIIEYIKRFSKSLAKKLYNYNKGDLYDLYCDVFGECFLIWYRCKEKFDEMQGVAFQTYFTKALLNYQNDLLNKTNFREVNFSVLDDEDNFIENLSIIEPIKDIEEDIYMQEIQRFFDGEELIIIKEILEPSDYLLNFITENGNFERDKTYISVYTVAKAYGIPKSKIPKIKKNIATKLVGKKLITNFKKFNKIVVK